MYEVTLRETQAAFATHLSGEPDRPVCVISDRPLSAKAQDALLKSADRLGYGRDACFWLLLTDDAQQTLDPVSVFQVIEGIDPQVAIVADATAAQAVELAYNTRLKPQDVQRVFGRTTLVLRDFETALTSDAGKQKAWAALKLLKRA